ncbi:MAG TPA: hypothetical protein VIY51_05715 [Xanthobacteraceae bacterium]
MSAPRSAGPGPLARIGALIAIVLVFVVLGPPIGAFAWVLMIVNIESLRQGAIDPFQVLLVVPIGYLFGIAPAAAGGLALGIRQAFFGRATWAMALAVGFVAGAILLKDIDGLDPDARFQARGFDGSRLPQYSAILLLTCVIPTMLCWVLVRSWYFAPRPSTEVMP